MQTLTEIVAAVVLHSSAAAYSHFGVTVGPPAMADAAPTEHVVARAVVAKLPPKRVVVQLHSPRAGKDCSDLAAMAKI